MDVETLIGNSRPFLAYILNWKAGLPEMSLSEAVKNPGTTAVVSVDMINGFCHDGPLSSPRVKSIVKPIVRLFKRARALGVEHFILTQDNHDLDAVEFGSYPPHCVCGTVQAETIPELQALDFYSDMTVIPKNSISSTIDTALFNWVDEHSQVDTFFIVGDCTDLCTYQLGMSIRLRASARNLHQRVVLPADCVDTYDLPVATAHELGVVPHDGDLLHHIFLYSMMLNGVEIVKTLK
jgi:nicotinamidase-related amidase